MFPNFLHKLKKSLPIIEWVSKYNFENAIADIIAGVTIGLTLIPQSIAYAGLAGLPPQVYLFFLEIYFGIKLYSKYSIIPL